MKIHDTSEHVKKLDYNAKTTEIENKIPSISSLAAKASLTTVENKIPNISSLVQKIDYYTKITEVEKILLIMIMINMLLLQDLII